MQLVYKTIVFRERSLLLTADLFCYTTYHVVRLFFCGFVRVSPFIGVALATRGTPRSCMILPSAFFAVYYYDSSL